MQKRKLSFSDFKEIQEFREKITELQLKRADMERELAQRRRDFEAAQQADPVEKGAQAIMAGEEPEHVTARKQELGEAQIKIQIFNRAEQLVRAELQRAEAAASLEICRVREPVFKVAWERFGKLLAEVSEEATALELLYDELRTEGVMFSSLPVSVPLGAWDARDRDTRINQLIGEIEKDWNLDIPRSSLAVAEKIRYERHMAEEANKAEHAAKEKKRLADLQKNAGKVQAEFFQKL